MHELILLYNEYKNEFAYRDRVYIGLHGYLGIKENVNNHAFDDEECDIDV